MENLNRVLLENVLPAHVAEHFLGRHWKNEVSAKVWYFFFFPPAFTVCRCYDVTSHVVQPASGAYFPLLLISAPLQGCRPLGALSPLISSILTSVSLSESNDLFPAAPLRDD